MVHHVAGEFEGSQQVLVRVRVCSRLLMLMLSDVLKYMRSRFSDSLELSCISPMVRMWMLLNLISVGFFIFLESWDAGGT